MTKTVILLNPYGTDVTDFVNGTPLVPQLLNGTIMAPGDTLYTLPYNWNVSGISNINAGVTLLDAKLHATSGDILVFGYSEGCQIADKWLTNDGPTSSISPSNLSFLLIGNADRKYGGFCYGQAAFNPVAWTGGKPSGTPYTVTDFTRQYDPIGDFPNATAIVAALDALEAVTAGPNVLNAAMQSVADVVASTVDSTAALNALAGLLLIHIDYLSVAVADAGNVSLVEGNITWVWSPTYPIPLLGVSTLSPRSDLQTRPVIEDAFDRPVTLPLPDYGALILALAPSWATQVPSAPVQQPTSQAVASTQTQLPTQQVLSLQSQLQNAIWQGFLQIVDGFLDLSTTPSDQLATWASGVNAIGDDFTASVAATSTFWQAAGTAITAWLSTLNFPTLVSTITSAWNTYMAAETTLTSGEWATIDQLLGVVGIDTTTGHNIQWASIISQITALQTLLASPPVSSAAWASWWTTTLEDLGVGSTAAVNTANFLSGNYAAAINANAWATRVINDLTILLDVFHLTYNLGTSTDPPGTLGVGGVGAGKPTWYSAWNDLLELLGLVNSTSTPTIAAPTIGTSAIPATKVGNVLGQSSLGADVQAILDFVANALGHSGTGHTLTNIETYLGLIPPANVTNVLGGANLGDDVTSVQGQATTQNTWWGRLMTDVSIYLDLFHVTYPVGSPSDGPTTTISGVRTWYSAIADILALFGVVHSVSAPSNPASDVGTATNVAAAAATTAGTNASIAIAANQATKDAIVSATTGAPVTGTSTTDVTTGLSNIPSTNIVGQTGAAVAFGAVGGGNSTNLSSATSGSISWTHAIATGDLSVLVFAAYSAPSGQTPSPSTVTYGGAAMTLLQREVSSVSGGADYVITEAWVLKAPPSGSKTVVVSVSGANFGPLSGDSVSYSASKVGTVGPNTGGGSSSLSMSAASTTGNMVVGAFGVATNFSALPAFSAYSKTQRYNSFGLVLGDAAGASSVAFGVTASGTASLVQWAGITVELSN